MLQHPAFQGYASLLLPWDDRSYDEKMPLAEMRALHATLRPYQQRGLAWLAMMSSLGLGGYLADDSDTSSHRTYGPR